MSLHGWISSPHHWFIVPPPFVSSKQTGTFKVRSQIPWDPEEHIGKHSESSAQGVIKSSLQYWNEKDKLQLSNLNAIINTIFIVVIVVVIVIVIVIVFVFVIVIFKLEGFDNS